MRRGSAIKFAAAVAVASSLSGLAPAGAAHRSAGGAVVAEREYCHGVDSHSVHRLYRAYFLRDPDAAGLAYWRDVLASGALDLHGISQMFSQSGEFQDRYGSLTNRAFVELVYRNVMGRAGDPTGLDYWTGLLDAGHRRGTVMVGFSDSAEFKERSGLVPPAPAAGDTPVLPETDPFTVLPAGHRYFHDETEDRRLDFYRWTETPYATVLDYTRTQLLCLGWTVVDDGSVSSNVHVRSENGISIQVLVFPVDATEDREAHTVLMARTNLP